MKKSYYLFNPGRMCRKDNALKFTPVDLYRITACLPLTGLGYTLILFWLRAVASVVVAYYNHPDRRNK